MSDYVNNGYIIGDVETSTPSHMVIRPSMVMFILLVELVNSDHWTTMVKKSLSVYLDEFHAFSPLLCVDFITTWPKLELPEVARALWVAGCTPLAETNSTVCPAWCCEQGRSNRLAASRDERCESMEFGQVHRSEFVFIDVQWSELTSSTSSTKMTIGGCMTMWDGVPVSAIPIIAIINQSPRDVVSIRYISLLRIVQ